MTGARKFARDYLAPILKPDERLVVDVCCGDRWVLQEWPNLLVGKYVGLDVKDGFDVRREGVLPGLGEIAPSLILSIYGTQHLLHEEARVWTLLRRIANADTRFVYVGRYIKDGGREMNRNDPLNGYCHRSLAGLAIASGWKIARFLSVRYDETSYCDSYPFNDENAFAATLEPIQ